MRTQWLVALLIAGCGGGGGGQGGGGFGDQGTGAPPDLAGLAGSDGGGAGHDLAGSGGGSADLAGGSCSDVTKNGSETDVDCGGGACPACAVGKHCAVGADCVTAMCVNTVCACPPNAGDCDNNPGNGCETDLTLAATCGACKNMCPGIGAANSDAICSSPADLMCGLTCRGENYDVDKNAANGCEVPDVNGPSHSQANAQSRGTHDCSDSTLDTFTGLMPSDARVHNPAVAGFDANSGSAPDWWYVKATGGFTCVNNYSITFSATGGGNTVCYKLTFITDKLRWDPLESTCRHASLSIL